MYTRRLAKLIPALGVMIASMALMAPTAGADTPAPGYEAFAGCPSPKENPNVFVCQNAFIKSGHFQMGSKKVPIEKTMTLSGGIDESNGFLVATSKGGLTKVKQQVPGGIIGITGLDWLVNFLGIDELKLFAVTELAGQPRVSPVGDIILPIRVHLENPVLGNNCYVGSFTSPITLTLTTGTTKPPAPNKPISGKPLTEVGEDPKRPEVFLFKDGTLVDNSFSAPGANGCVLTLFGFIPISINGLVNSQSGLPAAAGTNETVQNFDSDATFPSVVYP